MKELLASLKQIGGIKTGEFKLKSGVISPIYIDLRPLISHPTLLKAVAEKIGEKLKGREFDFLCGVPYTALPIATSLSLSMDKPMVMTRKEGAKDYGTKKLVEGVFSAGKTCVVVEDVVTTGSSVVESIEKLKLAGLKVSCVVTFVDREQGGREAIEKAGCEFLSVLTLSELLRAV